ncbi:MAG: coenzyme F420-0:L-glutamate ligase [Bdellovibrionales bacterium]|nr:coenzyme F420-0:L-glutamate ligase [Bdellovibrionales bacterium]
MSQANIPEHLEPLSLHPIKTSIYRPSETPSLQELVDFICSQISHSLVREKMLLAISTKLVSLAEGRVMHKSTTSKTRLIAAESDQVLGPIGYGSILTITRGHLLVAAGIDESNSMNGDYILYPESPGESARWLWNELRKQWQLQELGIVLTDSRTSPLRFGTTGFCVAHSGFRALESMVGQPDLFQRPLTMTKINKADALAATATILMGEAAEAIPLVLFHNTAALKITFTENSNPDELKPTLHEDMYYPLFEPLLAQNNS